MDTYHLYEQNFQNPYTKLSVILKFNYGASSFHETYSLKSK
jgi:hypothetical protein